MVERKYKIIKRISLATAILGSIVMAYPVLTPAPKTPEIYPEYIQLQEEITNLTYLERTLDGKLNNEELKKIINFRELERAIKIKESSLTHIEEMPEIQNYQRQDKTHRNKSAYCFGGGFLSFLLGTFGWLENNKRKNKFE